MPPPLIGRGIKRCFCLTSDWRLTFVCPSRTSGLSREQRPRKTKIGTEVDHITRDSVTTLKVKRSRLPGRFTHRRVGASGSCSSGRGNVRVGREKVLLRCRCSAARGASPTGRRGAGHIVAVARLQLIIKRYNLHLNTPKFYRSQTHIIYIGLTKNKMPTLLLIRIILLLIIIIVMKILKTNNGPLRKFNIKNPKKWQLNASDLHPINKNYSLIFQTAYTQNN